MDVTTRTKCLEAFSYYKHARDWCATSAPTDDVETHHRYASWVTDLYEDGEFDNYSGSHPQMFTYWTERVTS